MNNSKFNFGFDLFENFHDMCFILSHEGEILELNKTASDLSETDKNGINGKNFLDFIDISDRERFRLIFTDCLINSRTGNIFVKWNINNREFDLSISITPIVNKDNGTPDLLFILARDLTEQKRKEIDLLRFFTVAENTVNPLQITDITGKMVYVNKAFIQASGYTREELIGQNPRIFGSSKQSKKFWGKVWNTIKSGKAWFGEV